MIFPGGISYLWDLLVMGFRVIAVFFFIILSTKDYLHNNLEYFSCFMFLYKWTIVQLNDSLNIN